MALIFSLGICFYGVPPRTIADPRKVKCPLQLHFGQLDRSVGFSDPITADALEADLDTTGIRYEFYRYEGADHAFMNETRSEVFSLQASQLAFERACSFLRLLELGSR